MPIVYVPGHGDVQFPDNMSDEQIAEAIKKNAPSQNVQSVQQASAVQPKDNSISANTEPSQNWNPGLIPLLNSIAESPGTQAVLGAGDSIKNMLINSANILPGVNIPLTKSGQGTPYNVGNILGEIGGFLGGGEILDTARVAAKSLPYIGKAASALEGGQIGDAARRILGSTMFGTLENPQDKTRGALTGAALGVGGEAAPIFIGMLTKPRNVAQGIKDFIQSKADEAESLYKQVSDSAGNKNIYTNNLTDRAYSDIDKDVFNFNKDIKNFHNEFTNNPTLENAHNLQSQLGYQAGKYLNKPGLSIADNQKLQDLMDARSAIRSDISSYLQKTNPDLADAYQKATDIFRENVAPFKSFNSQTPTEISKALGKIDKKGKLTSEMQQKLNDLNSSLMGQKLASLGLVGGLGGLGISQNYVSPMELIAGIAGGKLLGVKSPKSLNDITQSLLENLNKGSLQAGNVAKATLMGQQ